jgi:transmembrane protein EpsG
MVYAFNAFALALLFIPLTWVNPSAMRVVQYFSIFMLLLVPEIIHSFAVISVRFKKDITIAVIVVLIALMIKANANAAPYGFFWEEMKAQIQ